MSDFRKGPFKNPPSQKIPLNCLKVTFKEGHLKKNNKTKEDNLLVRNHRTPKPNTPGGLRPGADLNCLRQYTRSGPRKISVHTEICSSRGWQRQLAGDSRTRVRENTIECRVDAKRDQIGIKKMSKSTKSC